jgi:hypothetical protein
VALTRHKLTVYGPPTAKGTIMALVHFITTDSGRIEFDPAAAAVEYRCDHCGRFVAPDLLIDVHINVMDSNGVTAHAEAQGHAECVPPLATNLASIATPQLSA